jgi:GAF domain-containing protein
VTPDLHVVESAALLRELTARMLACDELPEALDALVDTTTGALRGPAWCGVTLLRSGGARTLAVSDPRVTALDDVQYAAGDGPCLHALRTRETVVVQNLGAETRWQTWSERAVAAGVSAVLAAPVEVDDDAVGALNLYAGDPGALDARAQLTVLLVAEHAGLLIGAVLDRTRRNELAAELRDALTHGEVVNRAVGVVMAQRGCAGDEALTVLRQAADSLAVPLDEVARRLVESVGAGHR